ncbi:MAG: rhodanese-like domain-containing protein [Bacteroidetes bacterium]|nr:rhodanese-like domain-containing protein [Bacteroidota bacterium]
MNKRYLILSALLILAGIGLVILPQKSKNKELTPEELLMAIKDPSRFVSTDLITDRIIKKDPSLVIVDVRPAKEFKIFSLPGSVNIPMDSLLSGASMAILKPEGKDKVFCSDDDILADQAWQIFKRLNISNIFIMKTGVNGWINTIMKDNPPLPTEDSRAYDLYSFRKAARQYFQGKDATSSSNRQQNDNKDNPAVPKKEKLNLQKSTNTKPAGGGC